MVRRIILGMSETPETGGRRLPRPIPFHPLLFVVYPALFLYSQNLGEVGPSEVIGPLLVLVGVALAALIALSLVFRDPRRAAIVVSVFAIGVLTYGFVDLALPIPGWLQQIVWLAVMVGAVVVAIRIKDRLPTLTTALNGLSVVLVGLTLIAIVPHAAATVGGVPAGPTPAPSAATTPTGASAAGAKPRDIYWIVLDRYGSTRALDLGFKIEGNDFPGWLAEHGFSVNADSHANYVKTSLSMASTLRMDFLDDIATRMGKDSDDHQPVFDVFQDPPAGRFLKDRGYRYVHIGSYFSPTRSSKLADENLQVSSVSDFATALYDYSALPAVSRRFGLTDSAPVRERHRVNALFDFDALEHVRTEPGPKFVLAHVLMPHPPYVFKADGTFVPDESTAGGATFTSQLAYTNARMKAILEPLLALPEADRPIIVVQADEGPYPTRYARDTTDFDWSTATADELETKYGILNAMYLPGLPAGKTLPYPTISSVNTFRLLFDDYFDANLPLLPDRSFSSRGKYRPYDLTEVTGRLSHPPPLTSAPIRRVGGS